MFVRTASSVRAFRLDSMISLEVIEVYTGTHWGVRARLSDGSITDTGRLYETQAAAQEAFKFLIDAVGWVNPLGEQV